MLMSLVIVYKEIHKYIRNIFVKHIMHEFSNKVNIYIFRVDNPLSLNIVTVFRSWVGTCCYTYSLIL